MGNRIVAIGDIHGHAKALAALLRLIQPQPDDTLVTLGDYVDGGPDSKGVLDQLIELEGRCHLVPLMGNHEEMMLGAKEGRDNLKYWLQLGGEAALDSYGPGRTVSLVPWVHWNFLKRLRPYYESDHHFFVHASYWPNQHLHEQSSLTRLWEPLNEDKPPGPHYSKKIAVVGHTPQKDSRVSYLEHLVCIDTGCGYGGWLTALDVTSGRIWQVDEAGLLHNGQFRTKMSQ